MIAFTLSSFQPTKCGAKFMRLSRTMWEMSLMLNSDCSGLHRSREAWIYWCPNFFEPWTEAKDCFCDLMRQSFSRWSPCLWSWGFTEDKSTQPHFSSCSPSWITVSWTVGVGLHITTKQSETSSAHLRTSEMSDYTVMVIDCPWIFI